MSRSSPLTAAAARLGGRVLRRAVVLMAHVRSAPRPMHPLGLVYVGRLVRPGSPAELTGSAFLDEPGDDEVLVRQSRAAGLPPPWPDVNGLAVRLPAPGERPGDLLLSTTGRGRLTRYLLAVSRSERSGFFTSLVPYRSPSGPVHLGARSLQPDRLVLYWARPGGDWRAFGELVLSTDPGRDLDVSFDAVLHPVEGLEHFEWHRRLRAPSYAAARRLRGAGADPGADSEAVAARA